MDQRDQSDQHDQSNQSDQHDQPAEWSDHDRVTRRSFEQQVGLFTGEHAVFAHRPASALAWLEPLARDMIVLDVACGAGHVAEQVAPHVRQVVGVDLTPALLQVGAERLAEAGVTNVLLQVGHALRLPFVDASFDVVLSRSALHHLERPADGVAEMARVCRPGGRVVISDMVATSAQVRDAFDRVHRNMDPSHVGVLLEAELAALLEETVGPLAYGETSDPIVLPVDHILTDVADRQAVLAALEAELDGGPATGFHPERRDGEIQVSFRNTLVQATRAG